jgi:hypothetical protein
MEHASMAPQRRLQTGRKALFVGAAALAVALLGLTATMHSRRTSAMLELGGFELVPIAGRQRGLAAALGGPRLRIAHGQKLYGGAGLVTTGKSVDGRPTVPGLHTDCVPGVLTSDCSPAQEDGAWSVDAMNYLDKVKALARCQVCTSRSSWSLGT